MGTQPLHMEIDDELMQQLQKLARMEQCQPEELAARAIRRLLEELAAQHERIDAALNEAAHGAFISEPAMTAWLESLGTQNELPEPRPDILDNQS